MSLYEIHNGYTGESYVRAYAWAPNEEFAIALYSKRNPNQVVAGITKLFDETDVPFCTPLSDNGYAEGFAKAVVINRGNRK